MSLYIIPSIVLYVHCTLYSQSEFIIFCMSFSCKLFYDQNKNSRDKYHKNNVFKDQGCMCVFLLLQQ